MLWFKLKMVQSYKIQGLYQHFVQSHVWGTSWKLIPQLGSAHFVQPLLVDSSSWGASVHFQEFVKCSPLVKIRFKTQNEQLFALACPPSWMLELSTCLLSAHIHTHPEQNYMTVPVLDETHTNFQGETTLWDANPVFLYL